MVKKKILIAETSVEFVEALYGSLDENYEVRACHDGISAKELLETTRPDVLVMDLALPGIDGISLLKQISALTCRPRILLTTCFMSPYVENAIAGLGVDLLVLKPCQAELVAERIQDLLEDDSSQQVMNFRSGRTISGILMELNLPSKRRGFVYLERAIKLHLEQPAQALTKNVYPELAKTYHTQTVAVERAMRQLIHESWERRDDKVWRMYFAIGRDGVIPRPTNAEFIAVIAERYKLAHEEKA